MLMFDCSLLVSTFSRHSWLLLQSTATRVISIVTFLNGKERAFFRCCTWFGAQKANLIEFGIRLYGGCAIYFEGLQSYTKVWVARSASTINQGDCNTVKSFNTRPAAQRPAWLRRRSRLPGPSWRDWPDPSKCFRCKRPNSASASPSLQARCSCRRGRK